MKKDKKKKGIVGTLSATVILILVALILVCLGYLYLFFKNGYKFDELIDNIVGNLIGVLAAFLLFDILYNKMTQDAYTKETSQQITKTLIGDPQTLDAFCEEDKKHLLISTVRSLVGDDDGVDLITGNMEKYFDKMKMARIRKSFNYTINVLTEFPETYNDFLNGNLKDYFYVQENLFYEVKYLSGKDKNLSTNEVKIGFSFTKKNLDSGLLEYNSDEEFSRCIFNESLEINIDAIEYLKNQKKNGNLYDVFNEIFTPVLKIDGINGELKIVDLRNDGIIATYDVNFDTTLNEHSVKLIFHMPKLWNSIFEVTLVDPTKDPKITFDYVPEKMDVTMYSYLNKEKSANDGANETQNGLFDITIKNEWIYPKSGIVFHVKEKQ